MKSLYVRSVVLAMFVLTYLLTGCAASSPSSISVDSSSVDTSSIPDMALEVLLHSSKTPDEYLGYIRQRLEQIGFSIETYNTNVREIWTGEAFAAGRSMILKVTCDYDATYLTTIARLSARISYDKRINPAFEDESEIDTFAYWTTNDDYHARAFVQLIDVAQRIEHDELEYAVFQRSQ